MSWRWNTAPLGWEDRCCGCLQSLRLQADGGIVVWTDRNRYHVSCLLDTLAREEPPPVPIASAASVSHWGLMP